MYREILLRPVRLAYQPPANSSFLSEQTNHQPAVLFSQNKSAPTISHQPNEQAVDWNEDNTTLVCQLFAEQKRKGNRLNTHLYPLVLY
jgi:hypothetical protein